MGSSSRDREVDVGGTQRWHTRDVLQRSLKVRGCVACAAVNWFEWKSIHSFLYEGMMFPDVRDRFLRSGGFCLRHFTIAAQIEIESWRAGGVGMAILCQDLINGERKLLRRENTVNNKKAEIEGLPGANCMFCCEKADKERILLEVLEEVRDEEPFRRAIEGQALCIRHARIALSLWSNFAARQWLVVQVEKKIEAADGDLGEFIRKHDYRYRDEDSARDRTVIDKARELILGNN